MTASATGVKLTIEWIPITHLLNQGATAALQNRDKQTQRAEYRLSGREGVCNGHKHLISE